MLFSELAYRGKTTLSWSADLILALPRYALGARTVRFFDRSTPILSVKDRNIWRMIALIASIILSPLIALGLIFQICEPIEAAFRKRYLSNCKILEKDWRFNLLQNCGTYNTAIRNSGLYDYLEQMRAYKNPDQKEFAASVQGTIKVVETFLELAHLILPVTEACRMSSAIQKHFKVLELRDLLKVDLHNFIMNRMQQGDSLLFPIRQMSRFALLRKLQDKLVFGIAQANQKVECVDNPSCAIDREIDEQTVQLIVDNIVELSKEESHYPGSILELLIRDVKYFFDFQTAARQVLSTKNIREFLTKWGTKGIIPADLIDKLPQDLRTKLDDELAFHGLQLYLR